MDKKQMVEAILELKNLNVLTTEESVDALDRVYNNKPKEEETEKEVKTIKIVTTNMNDTEYLNKLEKVRDMLKEHPEKTIKECFTTIFKRNTGGTDYNNLRKLGLQTRGTGEKKIKKHKGGRKCKRWRKSEINLVMDMYKAGKHAKTIARRVGRTALAVSGLVYRQLNK